MGLNATSPAIPVSDHRFLQSFLAVNASAVLVFGTLVLLTSTAPWRPAPQVDSSPSTPDAAKVSKETTASIDEAVPEVPPASGQAGTPEETGGADATRSEEQAESEAPLPAPVTELHSPTGNEPAATGVSADATSAPVATPSEPATPVASDKSAAATDEIAATLATLPPRPDASEKSDAATAQVATALAATPPAPQAPAAADTGQAATVAATEVVTPPPPLPLRKPVELQIEQKVAVLPSEPQPDQSKAQAQERDMPQQDDAQTPSGSRLWQPMALAPADKAALKMPTARPSGPAYASKVWAALARHKPRVGMRGSATVVFSISGNGWLRGVQVGRSSGNARIDQLALQTVRSAAPFPPPPSGVASYTIRIDFQ